MNKNKQLSKFFKLIGIIFLILFTVSFFIDKNNTNRNNKDYVEFSYNFFNSPYKYIVFKNIDEKKKDFSWVSKNPSDPKENTIILLEIVYFNSKSYYTKIDEKQIKFD